jgi:cobalt-zinc-cadmium efflux system outer membrane protein
VKYKFSGSLIFLYIAFFFAGCQSYEPAPLDIDSYRSSLEKRLINIEPITAFASRIAPTGEVPVQFDTSDGISPSEGEVIALFYNPELRIARLEASAALANYETSGLWKDPVFGFNGAEISSPSQPFQFGLMANVSIPLSGRLKVEKARAGTMYETQLMKLINEEWNIRSELRQQWVKWTTAALQVPLIQEVIVQLEKIISIADSLVEVGEINRVEYRLLTVELASYKVKATEATLHLLEEELALVGLMGLPADSVDYLIATFPNRQTTVVEDETARLIDANTELAILFAEYKTAEETLRLEIKKQFPDIEFGSGYGSEFNDHRVLFGLSIPLSIWNRNQAGIANARAQREVARAEAETVFARIFRELTLANTSLLIKKTQRLLYENDIIPMLKDQSTDIIQIVELGEVDTFVLLETVTRQYDAKNQLLQLQADEINASIDVHRILGPEYRLHPSPIHREQTIKETLGGVQ